MRKTLFSLISFLLFLNHASVFAQEDAHFNETLSFDKKEESSELPTSSENLKSEEAEEKPESRDAQNDNEVLVEGRYHAEETDSPVFIQKVLFHEAYKAAISEKLKQMGLNDAAFWQYYEKEWEGYFAPLHEEFIEQAKTPGFISSESHFIWEKKLEFFREKSLHLLIKSHAVDKFSRSPQGPNIHYVSLRADVDWKKLKEMYDEWASSQGEVSSYTLYLDISADFGPIGIERWSIIEKSLLLHLKKMVEKEKWSGVKEVEFFQSVSPHQLKMPYVVLRVNYRIKEGKKIPLLERTLLDISGDVKAFKEMNRPFFWANDIEQRTYTVEGILSDRPTHLASFLYGLPLKAFKDYRETMRGEANTTKSYVIHVENATSIVAVYRLVEQLNQRGARFSLNGDVEQFGAQKAILDLKYKGSEDEFMKFLKTLHGHLILDSELTVKENELGDLVFALRETNSVKEEKVVDEKTLEMDAPLSLPENIDKKVDPEVAPEAIQEVETSPTL